MSALRDATVSVVRAALAGGHLDVDELRLVLIVQDRLGSCAEPTLVLPLLRWKFLPSEALPALLGVYKRAVAASAGPPPPPPVIHPAQRSRAMGMLADADSLLLTHPDLDAPAVQAFMRDAGASTFTPAPASERLARIVNQPGPRGELELARALEDSDEGHLELGPPADELFEDSDEGPLELESSASGPRLADRAPTSGSDARRLDESDDLLAVEPPEFADSDEGSVDSDERDLDVELDFAPNSEERELYAALDSEEREVDVASESEERELDVRPDSPRRDPEPVSDELELSPEALDDSSDVKRGWGAAGARPSEDPPRPQRRSGRTRGSRRSRRAERPAPDEAAPAEAAPASPQGDYRYEFRGSPWGLLCWQGMQWLALAGLTLGLVLGLPGCGWPPAEDALDLVFVLLPDLAHHAEQLRAAATNPPPWTWLAGSALLLVVAVLASNAVRLYRVNHTHVFGMRLSCKEGSGLGEDLLALLLTALTAGLALPWVIVRRRRAFYRSCQVHGTHFVLDFRGSGLQALGLLLATLVSLPLVVLSLGLWAIRVQLWWIGWERRHTWIPDGKGGQHALLFEGKGRDYFAFMAPRQLASLLTLGLYRPWALVAAWGWLDRHTSVDVIEPDDEDD
jgi:hypothetical protein